MPSQQSPSEEIFPHPEAAWPDTCGMSCFSAHSRGERRFAFTLIELLLVIAIMAILMAILLPTLKNARDEAKKLTCLNNLKQNGLVLYSYANDYNGVLFAYHPTWAFWYSHELWWRLGNYLPDPGWPGYNLGYLAQKDILYCPSRVVHNFANDYWYRQWTTGYGPNYETWWARGKSILLTQKAVQPDPGLGYYDSSNWILCDNLSGIALDNKLPHQGRGANVLFLDGHVKWIKSRAPIDSVITDQVFQSKTYGLE